MSSPAIPELMPPIIPADYWMDEFEWCQVLYLYARELTRSPNKTEWDQAVQEGNDVVSILKGTGAMLTPDPWLGSKGPLVHWPTLVCAANAYASLEPERRGYLRDAMRAGASPSYALAFGEGGCDRKVLDDKEYHPAPPCVPQVGAQGFFLAVGTFAAMYGGLTLIGWLWRDKRRPPQR